MKQLPKYEQVTIESYAAEGKCIGRVEGKVIFVENVVPGDVVTVQLTKQKKEWAEGFAKEFHSYSATRTAPICQHFGVCGGCQWQMLPYQQQLQYKQQQVVDNLTRIGKLELPPISPIIGCVETVYYRNKMEYTFATKRFVPHKEFTQLKLQGEEALLAASGPAAGFHAKGIFDKIVGIEKCHLQAEPTNDIRNAVVAYAAENGLTFYDIRQHTGYIRNLIVRCTTTNEWMVNIVLAEENKPVRIALLDYLLAKFPQITTLLYTINAKWNDSLYDQQPITYFGKGYITEKLGNYYFKISPKSFFQTNSKQAETLYDITKKMAELDGSQNVYDLYCGTGSIGIFLSDKAKQIVGVEMVEDAIVDAKENALLNNLQHTHFYAGDVIKICDDDFFTKHGRPDVVITDPPRAGMHEKLTEKLLEIAAPLIVYVSCNPATQARDLQLLSAKYAVTAVQPVDMFPHTLHIENVVQLKLKDSLAMGYENV